MSKNFDLLHRGWYGELTHERLPTPARLNSPEPQYEPGAPQREKSLWDHLHLLQRRWPTVAMSVAVICMLVGFASVLTTPIYRAVGRLSVNPENGDALGFKGAAYSNAEDPDTILALDTQVDILQSDSLASATIEKLDLNRKGKRTANQIAIFEAFKHNLEVSRLPRSRVIEIRFSDSDAQVAADVVNTLIDRYLETNFRNKFQATARTSQWLSGQLNELKARVESSQETLVNYQKKHGILGFDDKQNIITSKLDDLSKDLTSAEVERIQKEANYRLSMSVDPELLAGSDPNILIHKLRAQQSDLRNEYAQTTATLGPAHPTVRALQSQLNQLDVTIQNEIRKIGERYSSEYLSGLRREHMLRAALEAQKKEAHSLNESGIEYTILKRDYESNRQLYDGLLQRYKEAGILSGLRADNVRVLDDAVAPNRPFKPNLPRNLGLGALMSLMGGIALAFILEKRSEYKLQERLCTPNQVRSLSGLYAFGLIPAIPTSPRKQLPATAGVNEQSDHMALASYSCPTSRIAEAYRALRTSILLSLQRVNSKAILITSALPREGKTTTSVNLATVLAQNGAKVLLVDTDLRRPCLHAVLGMKHATVGLSTVLMGLHRSEDAILRTQQQGLFLMPAGPRHSQPAELLSSAPMRDLCDKWRNQFSYVVLDTPPVLAVTDPVLLAADIYCVLLVVRLGDTPIDAFASARDQLMHVCPGQLGVVLNGLSTDSPYYRYYGVSYVNAHNTGPDQERA
jgi:succinoglycan biosynthesis transport protein ExoP